MFSTCSVVDVVSISVSSLFLRDIMRDRVLDSRVSIYSDRYVVNNSLACEPWNFDILYLYINKNTE